MAGPDKTRNCADSGGSTSPRIKHGTAHSSEYQTYQAARQRCLNPRNARYPDYGGRGIQFRFESFEKFLQELGKRPPGLVLDRPDNDGHYEPGR